MKVSSPSLAPMLRSVTQGRILARVLADPEKEHNLTELAALVQSSMPTVQREVGRAERAGIVATRKVGPARLVRANVAHPLHGAFRQIILGTYGPPEVIAREFSGVDASAVLLIGSWAARYLGEPGRAPRDVDVLVVGSPDRDAVDDAAERSERDIGLPVQATVRSRATWIDDAENFVNEVKSRPLVLVLVDDRDEELSRDVNGLAARQGVTR